MCCGNKTVLIAPSPLELVPAATAIVPAYTDQMAFPMHIVIPYAIATATGANRHLYIERADQPLPAAVVAWLQREARYRRFFADEQPIPPAQAADEGDAGGPDAPDVDQAADGAVTPVLVPDPLMTPAQESQSVPEVPEVPTPTVTKPAPAKSATKSKKKA